MVGAFLRAYLMCALALCCVRCVCCVLACVLCARVSACVRACLLCVGVLACVLVPVPLCVLPLAFVCALSYLHCAVHCAAAPSIKGDT